MRTIKRVIPIKPNARIWYLIDSNFLVNRYLDPTIIKDEKEKKLVRDAHNYWEVIDQQQNDSLAIVFILDICIAETFKTLAKKYYLNPPVFPNVNKYNAAKKKLRTDLQLSIGEVRKVSRNIKFHDIQTNRDIIIGVDRYFEKTLKNNYRVGICDLLILSTSKYLLDFYGFSKSNLFIITQDLPLYKLARELNDIPNTFNPSVYADSHDKVFKKPQQKDNRNEQH
jgi:hypothetical protein